MTAPAVHDRAVLERRPRSRPHPGGCRAGNAAGSIVTDDVADPLFVLAPRAHSHL